jgi:hypothetical protein
MEVERIPLSVPMSSTTPDSLSCSILRLSVGLRKGVIW